MKSLNKPKYCIILPLLVFLPAFIFAQTTNLPVISSVSPDKFKQGQLMQELKITGSGFKKDLTIKFSKEGITLDSISEIDNSNIKCVISISSSAQLGKTDITITNPALESGTGTGIIAVISSPNIISLSPVDIEQETKSRKITIIGTGFIKGCKAEFSGPDSSNIEIKNLEFISEQEFRLTLSVKSSASTGEHEFSLINPDESRTASKINIVSKIVIESISPQTIAQGVTNCEVKIKGKNFNKECRLEIKSRSVRLNILYVISSTEIVMNIDVSEMASTGKKEFEIIAPDGGSSGFGITITPAPAVFSVIPNNTYQGSSGKIITILGSNFIKESRPSISTPGILINSFEVKGSGTIIANISIADNAVSGQYDIIILNPDAGLATGRNLFTINQKPRIDKVTPSGSIQGIFEQAIEIQGSGFSPESKVKLSGEGIIINSASYISANLLIIRITVDSKAPMELVDITILNPDGAVYFEKALIRVNKVDKESIYFGNINKFKNPAAVNKKKIFRQHPCYETILKDNISSDTAKYWLAISKINDSIQDIYKKMQKKYSYDLIGEIGYIVDKDGNTDKNIQDITDLVIKEFGK